MVGGEVRIEEPAARRAGTRRGGITAYEWGLARGHCPVAAV